MRACSRRRAFSIVELLVTIAVTTLVLGGVMVTFNKINRTTKNAVKGNELTANAQSLWTVLREDLANAGKGFNDIGILDLHYKYNPSFVLDNSEAPILFPIEYLQGGSGLDSEIIINRFDYDFAQSSTPTFIAAFDDPDAADGSATPGGIRVFSNTASQLDGVKIGDIFAVYKYGMIADTEAYQRAQETGGTVWQFLNDTSSTPRPKNEAMILQVTSLNGPNRINVGEEQRMQSVLELGFGDGDIFINNLTGNVANTDLTDTIAGDIMETGNTIASSILPSPSSGITKISPNFLFARKLGDSRSFHRIRYYVDEVDGKKVLVRSDNGEEQILLAGLNDFKIQIGLDIPNGVATQDLASNQMDGYVTSQDPDQWILDFGDWALSAAETRRVVGRHAVAAIVEVEFESNQYDDAVGDSPVRRRRRVHQQFRLGTTLPQPAIAGTE